MANTMRYDTSVMEQVAYKLNTLSRELSSCSSTLNRIAANIDRSSGSDVQLHTSTRLSMSSMTVGGSSVESGLHQYARALERYHSISNTLAQNVRSASRLIQETEDKLCGLATNTGSDSPYGGASSLVSLLDGRQIQPLTGGSKSVDADSFQWKDLFLDILGEFGSLGAIISALGKITSAPESLAKYIVTGVSTSVKWAKELMGWSKLKNFGTGYATKIYLKKLVGLDKYLKTPSRAASKWNAFKTNFGKGFKSGITSAASWITAGITSAVSNYKEFGGKITDRCVVEWATETAATVAIGAGTAAAVGAGFAAAGIAAPAIAVGATATVIYMGADALWKKTVGNGSTIVESVGHAVGDAYDTVKSGISQASQWVGEKWNSITSGFKVRALWA